MKALKLFFCLISLFLITSCNKDKDFQKTGLPVIYIKTDDGNSISSKNEYQTSKILITAADGSTVYANSTKIKGRGNYSWLCSPKKGYRLKLDEKVELFGMREAKDWVLIANYSDPTNIFNTVALELGQRFEMDFCNHTQHVELVINGKHLGNYLLTEKIEVKNGRVEVNTFNGGFLAELDTHLDKDYCGTSSIHKIPLLLHTPENATTFNRALSLLNKVDSAISKETFTYNDYARYIDVESLAKYLLHSELVCNLEWMHPKSIYIYSYDTYDKLHFGIPWDYDWAFGDARYFDPKRSYHYFDDPGFQTMGKGKTLSCLDSTTVGYDFFNRFFQDPEFCRIYKKVWKSYYKEIVSIDKYIAETADLMSASNELDSKLWLPIKLDQDSLTNEFQNYMRKRIEAIDNRISSY